jgi:hypothetical protein
MIPEFLRFPLRGERRARILLAVPIVASSTWVLAAPPHLLGNNAFLQDDWFYYVRIGLNFWETGLPTFDGLTVTNGFQPLWQVVVAVVVAPFALVGLDRWAGHGVLIVNLALVLLVAQVLFTLLTEIVRSAGVAAAIAGISVTASLPFLLNGMESSLLVLLVLVLSLEVSGFGSSGPLNGRRLAILAAAVVLARYDAILLLAIWGILLLPRLGIRRLAAIAVGPCLVIGVLGGLFLAVDGSPVPINAEVKQFWDTAEVRWYDGVDEQRFSGRATEMRLHRTGNQLDREGAIVVESLTAGMAIDRGRWFFFLGGVLLVALCLRPPSSFRHRPLLMAVGLSAATQIVYYGVFGFMFWRWYLSLPVLAANTLFCSTLFGLLTRWLRGRHQVITVGTAALMVSAMFVAGLSRFMDRFEDRGYGEVFAESSAFLRDRDPEGVIGSWAAGQIGLASNGPTINLEGLVGDQALLTANRAFDLGPYLLEREVAWVVQGFPFPAHEPDRCAQDWHRFNVGWHLRMKLLIDHPAAFETVTTFEGSRTRVPIMRVDEERLVESLRLREERRSFERRDDLVVPAEDLMGSEDARAWLTWPDSEGWAMSGSQLQHRLPVVAEASDVQVRLRVLSRLDRTVDVRIGGAEGTVAVPVDPRCDWQVVDAGIVDLGAEGDLSVWLPNGVYLDEVYLG